MSTAYTEFLARKSQSPGGDGFDPVFMLPELFGFQQDLVTWATRMGRSAILADCGLGKTPMQLTWAENIRRQTGKPVLILTPLAVSFQTKLEAEKFGLESDISRDGTAVSGLTITNYEQLEKFDPTDFGGVVCDESSAIKAFDGQRRALVTDFMRKMQYRLLCTATAAPNDYIELGTSSEALGYLGHMDMLGRFFINDQNTADTGRYRGQQAKFRLKGHADDAFWRWVTSWARAVRRPSDIGYSDDGYDLPELILRQHVVVARQSAPGTLFDTPAQGLREEREESRRTLTERCEKVAELLAHDGPAVAWCHLNDEGDLLTRLMPGAVQVAGSDTTEDKEAKLAAFGRGEIRVLVTKPKIGAWGLNWTHCNRMTFFPSHSYEQYYQAVRRSWRFRQERPVTVDLVTTEGGVNALRNLTRKAAQADAMFTQLVSHMGDSLSIQRTDIYDQEVKVPPWATSLTSV